ncbi:conserved hypothetical protein [Coccidioides posadasii str. Silveira]|uniref:Uncharacterized protein n=1 Tax=Coccidioides posadasii (strain RMSCC 757 / Silveira) TaxID=443226 RepID=E9DB80_COCPS|nr:conserved hypothetical protein [Coccidioides posadasii str. Silveira]
MDYLIKIGKLIDMDKHFLMFVKKKPEQKLSAVKKELTIDNTLCGCYLMFVYTVYINKSYSHKQEIIKICTNYTEDKKACASVSLKMQKKVAALLSDYDDFLRLKNITLQEELKTSIAEQITNLSEMLAKMASLSVQTDNSLSLSSFNTEVGAATLIVLEKLVSIQVKQKKLMEHTFHFVKID